MKSLAIFLVLQLGAFSQAAIYNYDYWWPKELSTYFEKVNETRITTPQISGGVQKCMPVYKNALSKGVLDIHYALGYFDDSQAIDILYDNKNLGLSPSLDIAVFDVIRGFLKAPCAASSPQKLCGFEEQGEPNNGLVILTKKITLLEQSVTVRVSLSYASASENFVANKTTLNERQKFLTQQSEQNYFGAIGSAADVVIYNGHSRNGGGPDFNPPLLKDDLHVNYDGYYQVKKPGISRVLEMIKNGKNKDQVIGFFSCYSQRWFYDSIMKANPKQKVVFSADTIDYLDSLQASLGYVEGFMQGYCGQDLADIAKQSEKIKVGFQGFQIR
ncbi:MAG: hypothetical protein ABL930_01570 [Pseudobdellovibrio sp.]